MSELPVDPSGGGHTCSHPPLCPLSALPALYVGALYGLIQQEMVTTDPVVLKLNTKRTYRNNFFTSKGPHLLSGCKVAFTAAVSVQM